MSSTYRRRAPRRSCTGPGFVSAARSRTALRHAFSCDSLEARLLLATVSGQVWNDGDGDGRHSPLERGLPGWTLYVDGNNNGAVDTSEARAVTDASGNYSITSDNFRVGTLHVREVPQAGWRPSDPDDGEQPVLIGRLGDTVTGVDFGNTQRARVTGTVFNDVNEDGSLERGEIALSGWTVYADADNDGVLDAGETSGTTDANGDYALNVPAGSYAIRQVTQAGWWQTAPAAGSHPVTVTAAQVVAGRNFGDVVSTIDLFGIGFAVTSPSAPVPADGHVDVLFQIKNDGTADARFFRVAFFLSDDADISATDTSLGSALVSGLAGHATRDLTTTLSLPASDPFRTDNEYFVGMIVDAFRDVAETNESNNSNLGVLSDRFPVSSEGDLPRPVDGATVLARELQLGVPVNSAFGDEWSGAYDQDVYRFTATAGHTIVAFVDTFSDIASPRVYDAGWAPVGSMFTAAVTGSYYVVAVAQNRFAAIGDPRLLAGRSPGDIVPPYYKLSVVDVSPDFDIVPSPPLRDEPPGPLEVEFFVQGHGFGVPPPRLDIGFYLSDDSVLTTQDRLLTFVKSMEENGPPGLDTYSGTLELTLPPVDPFLTDNDYFVGFIVDPLNSIIELDESDNVEIIGRFNSDRNSSRDLVSGVPTPGSIGDEWIGPYDQDRLFYAAHAGEHVSFDLDRVSGNLDSHLRLYDVSDNPWTLLASNDNGAAPGETAGPDSFLEYTFASDGGYALVVGASGNHTNDPRFLSGRTAATTGDYVVTASFQPVGDFSGVVFDDADADGVRDPGEAGLAGWVVFLDYNGDELSSFSGDVTAVTDATGTFTFSGVRPDGYVLREEPRAGWHRTAPGEPGGYPLALSSGQSVGPFSFGNVREATVSGTVFDDPDDSGTKGADEVGLPGRTVYADLNGNGVRDVTVLTFDAVDLPRDVPGRSLLTHFGLSGHTMLQIVDVDVLARISGMQGDVELALSRPGVRVVLVAWRLGPAADIRFDDESSRQLIGAPLPLTGSYRPKQPLSGVETGSPDGSWRVSATSLGVAGVGSVERLSIVITLSEPFATTDATGQYVLPGLLPGGYDVREESQPEWVPTGPPDGRRQVSLDEGQRAPGVDFGVRRRRLQVVGRHVFYNNSAFDGKDPAPNAGDDRAVAADKVALRAGGASGAVPFAIANFTSYTRGINGIMIDVDELLTAPTRSDFSFKVQSLFDPSVWADVSAPTGFSVRDLDPAEPNRRRVSFTWPDGMLRNLWLQVGVLANATTRRPAPDLFYFGNLVGETGDGSRAAVTARDLLTVRGKLSPGRVAVDNAYDVDRDGRVGATDVLAVRRNLGRTLAAPVFPTVQATPAAAPDDASTRATLLLKQQSDLH
jgi:hypothetical protein